MPSKMKKSKTTIFMTFILIASNLFADGLSTIKQLKFSEYKYLDDLALAANTDKSSAGHNYTKVYAEYFSPLKNEPLTFLEIGICHGNSVKLWENYFTNADLHFIDITKAHIHYFSTRSHYHFIDQANSKDLKTFAEAIVDGFDIIIDDGGHFMDQQIISFESLFPFLKSGGYYIIEDLHTSYWQSFGGGGSPENPISGSHSCIRYLQNLVDDLNYTNARTGYADDNKVPNEVRQKLNIYQDQIYSISFYKSLCFIQKK